jgi:hypothetical protein
MGGFKGLLYRRGGCSTVVVTGLAAWSWTGVSSDRAMILTRIAGSIVRGLLQVRARRRTVFFSFASDVLSSLLRRWEECDRR